MHPDKGRASKPHISPEEVSRLIQTARLWLDEVYGDTSQSALDEIETAFTSLFEQYGTLHALLTEITQRDVNGLWSDQDLVDRVRAALNPATGAEITSSPVPTASNDGTAGDGPEGNEGRPAPVPASEPEAS